MSCIYTDVLEAFQAWSVFTTEMSLSSPVGTSSTSPKCLLRLLSSSDSEMTMFKETKTKWAMCHCQKTNMQIAFYCSGPSGWGIESCLAVHESVKFLLPSILWIWLSQNKMTYLLTISLTYLLTISPIY